jgi:Pin2-interacting protein X1
MKLSHDPNNTKWTNDTQSFGHKIMTSQGWQPGDYLGAKNASHAEFHTAANASYIRVSIKDDNLGLGAKIGSGVGHGECTGLDAFTNLLGRLNGKDEDELEREQRAREDLKRAIYTERRWGSIRFVPGGFLIGDKIQHLIDGEAERIRRLTERASDDSSDSDSSSEGSSALVEMPRKLKKRNIEVLEEVEPEVVAIKIKKSKKKRKSKATSEDAEEVSAALKDVKISKKKSKKDRKSKREPEESEDDTEIKKRKKVKEVKKDRKEKKEKGTSDVEMTEKESQKKKKSKREKGKPCEKEGESLGSSQTTTKESTPSTPLPVESSGRSTPMMQGRHAVRSRNIAQKRLAHMDVASLNQVVLLYPNPICQELTSARSL